MELTITLLGVATGIGLWLALLGAFPPRRALADELAALYRKPAPLDDDLVLDTDDSNGSWTVTIGRPAAALLSRAGLPTARVRQDLAAMGRSVEGHLAEQATAGLLSMILPWGIVAVMALAGVTVPWAIPLWAGLVLAAAGVCVPVLGLRAEAAAHAATFRHALSAYLDLVTVCLAGGSGVEEAMADAAAIGHGSAFTAIRGALDDAHLTRTPPWQALGKLGARVGVAELKELAATVELAGAEGARVRTSLTARAAALRARRLSDTEAQAAAATERMSVPIVLLFAGFLAFVGFPALYAVLGSL